MEGATQKSLESSRVEQMAQKQNKIAQHLLESKLMELEKEMTLSRLGYRMFIKQLRYDISQTRKCTGHSSEARPPTGKPDTRVKRYQKNTAPELLPSSITRLVTGLSAKIPTEEPSTTEHQHSEEAHTPAVANFNSTSIGSDQVALPSGSVFLTEAVGGDAYPGYPDIRLPLQPMESEPLPVEIIATGPSEVVPDSDLQIKEAPQVMRLPTIFQTVKMKSNRGAHLKSRFLPPLSKANQSTDSEETSQAEPIDGTIQISFTPELPVVKEEPERKRPDISELLQMSLKRAADIRAERKRQKQTRNFKKKLAIERPDGLFRPDNVKLIHHTFKREELYNEHKTLLQQNDSRVNMPSVRQAEGRAVNRKVESFLTGFSL